MLGTVPTALGDVAPRSLRARFARVVALLTAVAVAMLGAVVVAPAAQAALAAGEVSVAVTSPDETLQGDPFTVTITAENSSATDHAYNTSFRLVLPPGVTLDSWSPADVAKTEFPQADGSTVVVWTNVTDLLAGTTSALTATVSPNGLPLSELTLTGAAYVNTNPRIEPTFSGAAATPGNFTHSATADTTPELVPFTITKATAAADGDGGELLRGVHDHRTAVTLTIDNNKIAASNSFEIVDYIPANLEFLGCGTAGDDNSAADEYTGSGPLNASEFGLTDCAIPSSVETLSVDPDGTGPLTEAIYTVVTWNTAQLATQSAGALAAGESRTISYVIGVPQNANELFADPAPSATGLTQGSNLDNNTGSSTLETSTEQQAENLAALTGTYTGSLPGVYGDTDTSVVSLEDLSIFKWASRDSIEQGTDTTWTLTVRTSEYTDSVDTLVVTDHVPDGLEVVSTGGDVASLPSTVEADGTTTVEWSGTTALDMVANDEITLTITTTALAEYRSTRNPVLAKDSWTNRVDLSGQATEVIDGVLQAPREVFDDSAATQEADPITLTKEVAAPVGGECGDGSSLAPWEAVSSTSFTPGDVVCWRITFTAPERLDGSGVVLTDFLPAGYIYLSSTSPEAPVVPASDIDFDTNQPDTSEPGVLTWDFGGTGADLDEGKTGIVVVKTKIEDATAAENGSILGNLAKLSYKNTEGQTFQLRTKAEAPWVEPILGLTKAAAAVAPASATALNGGDVVNYAVTVRNTGGIAADDVAVTDTLPAGIACADVDISGITPAGFLCADNAPARSTITGTLATVAAQVGATPGQSALTYSVTIPDSLVPGTALTNVAALSTYVVGTNDPSNPTFPYTSTLTASSTVRVDAVAMSKTYTTSVTGETGNGSSAATIGETIFYTVTTTLPAGTTLTNGKITDTVPSTLQIVPGSALITTDETSGDPSTIGVSGQVVTVVLNGNADPYTVGSVDEKIVFTVNAIVPNASSLVAGNAPVNRATTTADGMTSINAQTSTRIVEPNLDVSKADSDADATATPGETIGFTVTVENLGTSASPTWTSPAHDVEVVDTIPSSMTPLDVNGDLLAGNGTVGTVVNGAAVAAVGTWDATARTITWSGPAVGALTSVDPEGVVTLGYQIEVADPVLSPASFTNTVTAVTSSLVATPTEERVGTEGDDNRYAATAKDTLNGPRPYVTKSVLPESATIGQEVTYTVVASIPPSVDTFDATVLDTLPAGLEFIPGSTTSSCAPAAACGTLTASELTASGQSLGWFLGDVAADASQRDVTIIYRAVVTDVPANVDTATRVNSATIASNATDKVGPTGPGTVPAPGTFDGVSDPSTATVTLVEPTILLTKTVASGSDQVDSRRVTPGETVIYTITLENTGRSTAFDVAVADTTDPRFSDVTLVAASSTAGVALTDADPSGDGSLAFTVADIAAGATATITYTALVPDPLAADASGAELTNVAGSAYSSLPGTPTGERTYTSNDDTVELEGDVASLGDTVWFDTNGNGVQEAGELGVDGVTVTVTYLGADGVLDPAPGGDDEVHVTTTDENGYYLVEDLPEGDYLVVISGVPAGTANTYDEDSGTTAPDGQTTVTLADGDAYVTADFGIRGSGTVGDTVWLDQDGDGAQDAGEPGVGGVDVTVTWPATDGQPAGSVTTTTAPDGTWSVTGIPATDVTVTVDPDTYPAGTELVSEVKDATVDGTSTDALAAGETDNDYDFGLQGTGEIGDRVWIDTNADGVQDEGEPGIPGATVEVRWLGADGVPGTPDDLVVTTTTGDDGAYLVDGLPAGEYVVTVPVNALPTALAPTFDEDDGITSPNNQTEVTLPAGGSHLTADFGYVAETGVGDTIWLDTNGDGILDPGEPGIAGVEVTVTSGGSDGVLGNDDDIVRTTTTDENGNWLVTGLPAGPVQVEVTGGLPEGITPTYDADGTDTPGVSLVTLVQDVTDLDQDFGYVGANSIGDTVWVDIDADGVQDAGEPGLPGVTVTVTWLGQDGAVGGGDDIDFVTVTDADGTYLVDGLPNGNYEVAIGDGVPDGYTESYDETGELDGFSVVDGLGADGPEAHETADFGYTGTGAIGGTVWLDREVDGELDAPTEAGIPGIVIDVVWAGPDGVLGTDDDVAITTVTGEGGTWGVENMPPGPFTATVDTTTIPEGTTVVWDRTNGTTAPDGVYVGDLAPGEVLTDIDTAVKGTGSIGDLVWIDSDKDGVRDAEEPAATNVRVVVTWLGEDGVLGGGDDVVIEVRTDANGIYVADGLPAGTYVVTFDKSTFPKGTAAFADLDGGDPLMTTVSLSAGQVRTDVDLVLRPTSSLATTGATVGGILALAMLLLGTGWFLRRRASALAVQAE